MNKFVRNQHLMLPALCENLPIPFVSKTKKVEADGMETDKTEYIKFDFFVDWKNPASHYSKEFLIFKDGRQEEWIKWLMSYCIMQIGYRDTTRGDASSWVLIPLLSNSWKDSMISIGIYSTSQRNILCN